MAKASGCSGLDIEVENGRIRRERKPGIWKAMVVDSAITMKATSVPGWICTLATLSYDGAIEIYTEGTCRR